MRALLQVHLVVGLHRGRRRGDCRALRLAGGRFVLGLLAARRHEGQVLEELLDVGAGLGGHLHEGQTELLELLCGDVGLHCAFVLEVLLVTHDQDQRLVAAHLAHVVDPLGQVVVGVGVCVAAQVLVMS